MEGTALSQVWWGESLQVSACSLTSKGGGTVLPVLSHKALSQDPFPRQDRCGLGLSP